MSDLPSSINNVGPAGDRFFGRAGITTAEQIRDLGPDEAYFQALKAGGQPHFIGYYVLVMGLQGRPWNDCRGAEKADLKTRFEAIKARIRTSGRDAPSSALERELDALGIRCPTLDTRSSD